MMKDEKEPMTMVEIQISSCVEAMRPADPEVRKQLDIGYSWDGQAAILYELRAQWDDPTNILHLEFAKLRYIKSANRWKLYWMRGSGKWEAYDPKPESPNLQELLNEVSHDDYGCFFG